MLEPLKCLFLIYSIKNAALILEMEITNWKNNNSTLSYCNIEMFLFANGLKFSVFSNGRMLYHKAAVFLVKLNALEASISKIYHDT